MQTLISPRSTSPRHLSKIEFIGRTCSGPGRCLASVLILCLAGALQVGAQQRGGGFGGGGAGGGRATGTSSTTRQYYPNGAVGDAMVTSDPDTKKVVVITDEETSRYVSQVVSNLDRPKPQVLIKVVFMEVTYNNSLDAGLEGGVMGKIKGSTAGNASQVFGLSGLTSAPSNLVYNALGQATTAFVPTPPGAAMYQILGSDFQATLRAIATAGKTEVLSRPSILARNNQPATINVGQILPIITGSTSVGLTANVVNTIQYVNVGINLQVTPFITANNMVEMMVSPQISALTDQTVNVSPGVNAPVISNRSADTVVVTPDGQTVVIGGLMQNNKTQTDSKVPLLGDIPLLGMLFKHKVMQNTKTELIIFLTPHIVREAADLASLSNQERNNTVLTPKAFSEKDLDRFLDSLPAKDGGKKSSPSSKSGK